jgi:hypothetical protein
VKALLIRPIVVEIPSAIGPRVFGESLLSVRLNGYGSNRGVVIESKVLGQKALLGFVFALGQGAKRMQDYAWLRLEVCLGGGGCQFQDEGSLDLIVAMLSVCEELFLGGPKGLQKVFSNPTPSSSEGLLFKYLALTGLDLAAMEDVGEFLQSPTS